MPGMSPRRLRALVVGLACLAGCQSVDLTDDLNTFVGLYNEAQIRPCDCYQDLGFESLEECTDSSRAQLTQGSIECMNAALDGHERDGQEYLVCVSDAYEDYLQCLAANVSCTPGTYDQCMLGLGTSVNQCTQLKDAGVQADFDACLL